jgi:thiol-disulfide isomerase/thioredoxin
LIRFKHSSIGRDVRSVAVIVAAVLTFSIALLFSRPLLVKFGVLPRLSLSVGDTIPMPTGQNTEEGALIVFGRSSCGACQTGTPQLRRLADEARRVKLGVLLFTDRPEANREWAEQLGISGQEIIPIDFKALKVRALPTVAVVGPSGKIRRLVEGLDGRQGDLITKATARAH